VIVGSVIAAHVAVKNLAAANAGKLTAVTNKVPRDAPITAPANESTANA